MTLTDAALAAEVAAEAGELLLAMREEIGFYDPYDLGDAGDKRANTLILDRLRRDRPHDAVLSEEAADDLSRVDADRVWIVDPVDGTYEYSMPGRADWAVHIALWQRTPGTDGGRLTDAAVALPARGEIYRTDTVVPPPPRFDGPIRITASSNRPPAVLWHIREQLDIQLVRIGSAGAKAMAVVRGLSLIHISEPTRLLSISTSKWSGSARRAPRRWRWCAATSTPTSTPAGSGNGIRRHRPAWCRPPGCTPHASPGRR